MATLVRTAPAPLATQVSALLRLATAGSVDDGKSTLVGRLLYDTKSVLADQYEAVRQTSRDRGLAEADLALLTDGLRSEREQGITIDVAYRYFATPRRRFILADTPGHVQYTRNMVTGASTAQLAVVLVDARKGLTEQTRRHTAIAALLRVPRVLLAVNKMDLIEFDKDRFQEIEEDFSEYAASLGVLQAAALPVSALRGDNVVAASPDLGWFEGPTLLEYLETVPVSSVSEPTAGRFPVQYVIRRQNRGRTEAVEDYRGYAGTLASGSFAIGDEVVVLPSGQRSRISGIDLLGRPVDQARAGQAATLMLADDLDVSRGDLIAPADQAPVPTQDVAATVCHLSEGPLRVGDRVLLKHTTRTVKAVVRGLTHRLDVTEGIPAAGSVDARADSDAVGATGTGTDADAATGPEALHANDIGRVVLRTASPVLIEPYAADRETGSFLLINPDSGDTLTAGMAGDPLGVFS
ncbi:sulfate adenylyltransferase subunit 1 [Catenulispora pinisilvae]|uniref:sulfate adenylyltransferase subunit 1 n=1 Tax=Catenulispora pinisilvae TaxID=2705253 RepID=UPI001890D39B|nr:GTP-binding protein [Catenulispora pinisilvae]